jgi:digeranylgeranylglycerophospholipid reductase
MGADVEIVGAGFAGVACARTCASRGLRTLVWERKREPGHAIHTTGLLVKEAADEDEPPPEITRRIHGVRLYAPSLRWIDLDAPGYYFLATDTPALLRVMALRAEEAGAEIRCGARFPGMRSAPVLVGADGPRSSVARAAGLGTNRRFLAGVEAEFVGVRGVQERLHVFLDSQLMPGYIGWVVPGVGITQVGLACRADTSPDLGRFLRRVAGLFDFGSAHRVATRGGLIPVGGTVRPFATRDVVLVGDAAGVVSPLTAGGIQLWSRRGRGHRGSPAGRRTRPRSCAARRVSPVPMEEHAAPHARRRAAERRPRARVRRSRASGRSRAPCSSIITGCSHLRRGATSRRHPVGDDAV